jgi:hypothetical protein
VPEEALANATPYLQAFGHVVLAWIWLDVALARAPRRRRSLKPGKLAAMRYFFAYELPKIDAWLRRGRRARGPVPSCPAGLLMFFDGTMKHRGMMRLETLDLGADLRRPAGLSAGRVRAAAAKMARLGLGRHGPGRCWRSSARC